MKIKGECYKFKRHKQTLYDILNYSLNPCLTIHVIEQVEQ